MATDEDVLEFDEEAYITRENSNVVLTRDGWIKRVGRLASVEGTRVREGDEVIAVAPGSTLDHVAFFADDGACYTMRINEVPPSSGYGEPISKFFKLADNVKIIAAITADERFVPAQVKGAKGDPPGPYLLVATADGQVLRTPFAPYREASTKAGRRYVRLREGDKAVMVMVPHDETSIMLCSAEGRFIHFAINEINVLSGVGMGVIGIKLDKDDVCLGGALIGSRFDALKVETTGGGARDFHRGAYEPTSRGGKGWEAIKRGGFQRIIPPPIELVDWEKVEGGNGKHHEKNGKGSDKGLFD